MADQTRKLRGAMIGGGFDSFIGPVHRMAATMDGLGEFVAGVFSSREDRSREFGKSLFMDPRRVHGSLQELLEYERSLPPDERIDFVTICTPNDAHFAAVVAVLEAGFPVICDKPVTRTLQEALDLRERIGESGLFFGVTHNYTGYPMVKQARHMVRSGELGDIHKVVVEYPQGWLSPLLGNTDATQNPWRMDPRRVGSASTMGDIGTHGENLLRYVTGLRIESLCADLRGCVPTNPLDDDGTILLRFHGGARGVLLASQVSTGEENGLTIRVYGGTAGLRWCQENPNYLEVRRSDGVATTYSKGSPHLCPAALAAGRLPLGHPDGFIEAFANLYRESFRGIGGTAGEREPRGDSSEETRELDVPGIEDGIMGMQFIETVVASGRSDVKWTPWVTR